VSNIDRNFNPAINSPPFFCSALSQLTSSISSLFSFCFFIIEFLILFLFYPSYYAYPLSSFLQFMSLCFELSKRKLF
jgi:hypothetical protein